MSKKIKCNTIKKLCEKLPEDTYVAWYPVEVPLDPENPKSRTISVKQPFDFPINHGRRARRTLQRNGIEGLQNYFNKYGYSLTPTLADQA